MRRPTSTLAACLALLAVPMVAMAQPKDAAKDAKAAKEKVRVAVLYFEPLVSDPELVLFAKGTAALIIGNLGAWDQVRVLERERLEEVLTELKLGETRFADKATFGKIGKGLGAKYLLVGSMLRDTKTKAVILNARLVDVETWDTFSLARVKTVDDDVLGAVDALSAEAGKKISELASLPPPAEPEKKTWKLQPKTFQNYAKALDAKDKKDSATATKLLTDVVKDSPDFKLAQLDLLSLTK